MTKNIPIISLNIRGEAEKLTADHQSTTTAFRKEPITTPDIFLTHTGFTGDMVFDKKHHGGNDKAICCYSADRFTHWKKELNFDLVPSAFGENLTLTGDMVFDKKHHGGNDKAICCYSADRFTHWKKELNFDLVPSAFGENLTLSGDASLEENVFIGDRYQLGDAIVEVSEPRGPCYIIGIRYNYKPFAKLCQDTGYTGYYLRTIKEGLVKPDDSLVHLSSHPEKISVMHVNQIRYHDSKNKIELERLINLKELTLEWREKFDVLLRKIK